MLILQEKSTSGRESVTLSRLLASTTNAYKQNGLRLTPPLSSLYTKSALTLMGHSNVMIHSLLTALNVCSLTLLAEGMRLQPFTLSMNLTGPGLLLPVPKQARQSSCS